MFADDQTAYQHVEGVPLSDPVEPADREGVPPSISEMIRDYQARTGESLHRAAERSLTSGSQVAQSYLSNLKNGKAPGWPKDAKTYAAIAAALETTELAVVLGFAVERGVSVRMPAFASQLPPEIDRAPKALRDAVLALCWAVTRPNVGVRRFVPDDEDPDVTGDEGGLIGDVGGPPGAGEARA